MVVTAFASCNNSGTTNSSGTDSAQRSAGDSTSMRDTSNRTDTAMHKALKYFEGGIVAYTIQQKVNLLKVDAVHALTCNCVSAQIASEMAGSVAGLFNTEWGIAITGYSSPVPEMNIYTLFAFVAVRYKGNTVISERILAPGLSDTGNREYYTNIVLEIFREVLCVTASDL